MPTIADLANLVESFKRDPWENSLRYAKGGVINLAQLADLLGNMSRSAADRGSLSGTSNKTMENLARGAVNSDGTPAESTGEFVGLPLGTMASLAKAGPALAMALFARGKIPRQMIEDIVKRTVAKGGSTTTLKDLSSPKHGYMVSKEGSEVTVPVGKFNADDVKQYVKDHPDAKNIGTWLNKDDNTVYLDSSENVRAPFMARKEGTKNKQKAIYNLDTKRVQPIAPESGLNMERDVVVDPAEAVARVQAAKKTAAPNVLPEGFRDWPEEKALAWLREFGDSQGTKILHDSPMVKMTDPVTGKVYDMPAGLPELGGRWSLTDAMRMKGAAYPVSEWSPEFQAQVMKKLHHSLTPEELDKLETWGRLSFGLTSPGTPLTPNQFLLARLRPRSEQELADWAGVTSWGIGETPQPAARAAADKAIGILHDVQARGAGGLGLRGTPDLTRLSDLSKMVEKDHKWFRKREGESWADLNERIASIVPGLEGKTSSFGIVWQDPLKADISAVDRHIARKSFDYLFKNNPEFKRDYGRQAVELWNKQHPREVIGDVEKILDNPGGEEWMAEFIRYADSNKGIGSVEQILEKEGGRTWNNDNVVNYLSTHPNRLTLRKDGSVDPLMTPQQADGLFRDNPFYTPKTHMTIGTPYRQALEYVGKEGAPLGLENFTSQHALWDKIRGTFEPHEIMVPGATRLPRMSNAEYEAAREAHVKANYYNNNKPAVPTNWLKLLYWTLPPALVGKVLLSDLAADQESASSTAP